MITAALNNTPPFVDPDMLTNYFSCILKPFYASPEGYKKFLSRLCFSFNCFCKIDPKLEQAGLNLLDWSLDRGWDKEHGGIFNFVDVEGKPLLQLEWDMKPWWSHNEALYATLLAHYMTGEAGYLNWYETIHQYAFSHFADPEFGEWYGFLHRDGSIASPAKGSMWKCVVFIRSRRQVCPANASAGCRA